MQVFHCVLLLLLVLFIPSESLKCYECGCTLSDLSACNCMVTSDFDDGSYCFIVENRMSDDTSIQMTRVSADATYIEIEDTYYLLTIESIRYNRTTNDWSTVATGVVFGCDWDLCNSFSYVSTLPFSFQLGVDKTWLTDNLYGTGTVDSCRHCSSEICGNSTHPLDETNCPSLPCNKSSTVRSEIFDQ